MKSLLITAGPTREAIDPVRFITNHSSGKMGYALAEAAIEAGWQVTLVSGPVNLPCPAGVAEFVSVVSAAEMADAVKTRFPDMDGAILCAAVADYRPVHVSDRKIKKSDGKFVLELERTEDILKSLGASRRADQILVGFAAETDDLEQNALKKLHEKHIDWIAANKVGVPGKGFQADENEITLYGAHGEAEKLPLASKKGIARALFARIFL